MLRTIMLKRNLQMLLTAMLTSLSLWGATLASLSLWSTSVDAQIFDLNTNNRARPYIRIRVGNGGRNNISEVSFTVPATQVGNGTPIGSPDAPIRIELWIRATADDSLTGVLTVDSLSEPLKNTASSTTIPFSEISWTASNGDIPSGVYQETANQPLVSFQSSQRYRDFHTFSYANTLVIEAGSYEGSVKYTWAVP